MKFGATVKAVCSLSSLAECSVKPYHFQRYESRRQEDLSRFFNNLRLGYVAFYLILLVFSRDYLLHARTPILLVSLLLLSYSVLYHLNPLQAWLKRQPWLFYLEFFLLGALIYHTGGVNSYLHTAFLLPLVFIFILFGFSFGFAALMIILILILFMVFFDPGAIVYPAVYYVVAGYGTGLFILSLVSFFTIKELRLREEIFATSVTDHLTGLYHVGYLRERVNEEIELCRRENSRFALVFLDLNNFKSVNDCLGHTAGNRVLQHVAAVLNGAVRGGETLARYGGDEFVLLLPRAAREQAEAALDRLRRQLQENPYKEEGVILHIGVSGGTAVFPEEGQTLEQLLLKADRRMYAQKNSANISSSSRIFQGSHRLNSSPQQP